MWYNIVGMALSGWFLLGFIAWGFFCAKTEYKCYSALNRASDEPIEKIGSMILSMVLGGIVLWGEIKTKSYKYGFRVW
jgi:hypothetical protein